MYHWGEQKYDRKDGRGGYHGAAHGCGIVTVGVCGIRGDEFGFVWRAVRHRWPYRRAFGQMRAERVYQKIQESDKEGGGERVNENKRYCF